MVRSRDKQISTTYLFEVDTGMKMNSDSNYIAELLEAPEDGHCQFKEAKKRYDFEDALKCCCALSNCGGGKFVLGITDKRPRKVVGSEAFEQPERTREGLMNKLRVKVDFKLYKHEGFRILVFEIAPRPIGVPVQVNGIAWRYVGDSIEPIPPEVLRDIYYEAEPDFSGDICPGATLDDLDGTAVEVFRRFWADDSKNNRIKSLSIGQLMADCGAVINDGITYAALILFGKSTSLMKYLPQAEIIFEYRSSNASGPAQYREEFRIGFFACYDRLWELINLRNDMQHYQDGFHVLGLPTFNERVAREAVLNATSHRSYRSSSSIFVRQYRDRLVIDSPGGFPHGVTVENILEKQSPRNHLIANIFALCGLVERAGQGMNLMYEICITEAKPLPDFSGTDSYFVCVTLNGKITDEKLLLLFKRIGNEQLNTFTTEDYLAINLLYHTQKFPAHLRPHIKSLAEKGMVENLGRGRYLLARKLYDEIGESDTHLRLAGTDRAANKNLILLFIEANTDIGASLADVQQILPGLSQSQLQKLLYELKKENRIKTEGRTNKAKWYIT